jgi:aryl-alcohol dehydrogenase-like predicted oxidoreductase
MNTAIAKLELGGAQFGMDYGVSNTAGRVSDETLADILQAAARAGLTLIDTAPAYGCSEAALGAALPAAHGFRLVTKVGPIAKPCIGTEDIHAAEAALYRSLARLRIDRVYGLLAHRAEDLLAPGGERLYAALLGWKSAGQTTKIGVSVYEAAQIDAILARYAIDMIQIPFSLADQRLLTSGHLLELKRRGIEVHARSVFLQGLLLMNPAALPAFFEPIRSGLTALHATCRSHRLTPLEACLGFVLHQPLIDHVVAGVCDRSQLDALLNATKAKRTLPDSAQYAWSDNPLQLDPSQWPAKQDFPVSTHPLTTL